MSQAQSLMLQMAEKLLGIAKYFAVLPRIGGAWEDFKALWRKEVYIWDADEKNP